MKVLLINPPWHQEIYSNLVASLAGFSQPLGLASIAAYLRVHGHEVRIIDANTEQISLGRLAEYLPEGFRVIGTTSLTPSVDTSVKVMQLAKNKFPRVKTMMGGVHITAVGKEIMGKIPEIDFGVIGEGEETVLELADSLENNKSTDNIKGLIYRKGEEVIQNERRPPIANLDKLPFFAYDLLPMDKYRLPAHHIGFNRKVPIGRFALVFTSRGCPARCGFCSSKLIWGRTVRFRSARYVVEEIEMLVGRFGVKVVEFADDVFTLDKRRLHDILDGIIAKRLNIHFNCLSRVDTIALEDLEKMKKAGCYLIRYGVESGSQKILERMHKNITAEQVIKTLGMTKKAKIASSVSFMIGYLGETEQTVKETIALAKQIDADRTLFFIAVPFPGTEFFEIAKKENLILEAVGGERWALLSRKGILQTESLSREDLIRLRNKAYHEVGINPKHLWRYIRRIRTWAQVKICIKGFIAMLTLTHTEK